MTYECSHNFVDCAAVGDMGIGEICTCCGLRRLEVKLDGDTSLYLRHEPDTAAEAFPFIPGAYSRQVRKPRAAMRIWIRTNGEAVLFDRRSGDEVHVATFPSEYWAKRYAEMEYGCDPATYWQEGIF